MANASILAAFERMWQHIVVALGNKSDIDHTHDEMILYTEQSLTEEQKLQARNNIGIGETIVDTLATLDLISTVTDNDGSLAESDGTLLVTRNDDIFLPKVDTDNNGEILKVVDGRWVADTIEMPDMLDSIPTPLTAQVGQTIVVKAVDENGRPTEWECVNLPTDEHINALIDAKLADFALPSAEEVAF